MKEKLSSSHHIFKLTKKAISFTFIVTIKPAIMNFQLLSLNPRDRKQKMHPERTSTDLSLMSETVVNTKENIDSIPGPPRRNFPIVLQTIMENEPSEYMNAPCVTTRKSTTRDYEAKREPLFQPKSHQRSFTAEPDSATSTKRQHRRSLAMTEDEFAGIIVLCDVRGC